MHPRDAGLVAAELLTPRPERASWAALLAHRDVVETAVTRGPVGFLAFHAGLEAGTGEMARRAAEGAGASLYTVVQPADLRWHVPSVEVGPAGSPVLAAWLTGVDRVVAVHGYGRPGRERDVLVGGADDALADQAASLLAGLVPGLRFVSGPAIPSGLRGRSPANPVNLPAGGGVQLELPVAARAGVLADRLAAALVELARTWTADLPPAPERPGAGTSG